MLHKWNTPFWRKHPMACKPAYATPRSAGFDFHTVEDVSVAQGEVKLVSTGLTIATPSQHMLYITGRSSTPRRHGVQVITGIVDEDYCGPDDVVHIQVVGLRPAGTFIPKQTAIAQGIFIPVSRGLFEEQKANDNKSRGGFGSTG